jgi:predicted Zn-dependent protease with MMP-like domain/Flp pilus assembly protein TadD
MAHKAEQAAPALDALLREAAEALDGGEADRALRVAERARAADPHSMEAAHYRAAALVELGRLDDGREAYQKALALGPNDPELLLGAADLLISRLGEDEEDLEEGLDLCARARKRARKEGDAELLRESFLLEGIGLKQLGATDRALRSLDQALELTPRDKEVQLERNLVLFELCRFDEADRELRQLSQRWPEEPWIHHTLALIAERRGDTAEAQRRFARAHKLAPEEFPAAAELSEKAFDEAVEAAVGRLPAHVRPYLANTTISVEPVPSDEDLLSQRPPLSPSILGIFRGTPVGERSVSNAEDHFPASIVLYQRNLERFARTRAELIEQIGITVMHEVGHLVGLDEEDLVERGLD